MTSAIGKVMDRSCRAILAPIFTNLSRDVVNDLCFSASGCAEVHS
jgi:hypothetical protein